MERALFHNREEAGQLLATELSDYEFKDPLVVALPRGGVPVGYELARTLRWPLTVLITRKLGSPDNPELGVGAIGEGSVVVLNDELLHELGLTDQQLQPVMTHEQQELERRKFVYRNREPLPSFVGRTVILVDDGIATGYTMLAAVEAAQNHQAETIVIAVPVAAADTAAQLEREVDILVCMHLERELEAIAPYYADFEPVSDEEVKRLLAKAQATRTKNDSN